MESSDLGCWDLLRLAYGLILETIRGGGEREKNLFLFGHRVSTASVSVGFVLTEVDGMRPLL